MLNQVHDTGHEFQHHEHSDSFQKRFAGHVNDLSSEFIRLGNPFIVHDDSDELIRLGTRDVMDNDAVAAVRRMETIGVQQFEQFRTQRIVERVLSIDDTISKNNLNL